MLLCPIVLTQRAFVLKQYGNHDTSQLFKIAAPGKFESQKKSFEIPFSQI